MKNEAGNARTPTAGLTSWMTDSEWHLRNVLPRSEIERLLHTPRYWHVVTSVGSASTAIDKLANDELDDAKWRWEADVTEVKGELAKWSRGQVILVPDTNILLHQPKPFDEINWLTTAQLDVFVTAVRMVIPIIVVDEIDRIKDVGSQ